MLIFSLKSLFFDFSQHFTIFQVLTEQSTILVPCPKVVSIYYLTNSSPGISQVWLISFSVGP